MLNKAINKTYAEQIAGIFCEAAVLRQICIANVKNRIINDFTDEIFEQDFLPNLDTSIFRAMIGTFELSSPGYMRLIMNSTDIVNGSNKTGMLDGIPSDKMNDWDWIFAHLNAYYQSVAPHLHAYYLGVVNDKIIWQLDGVSEPYGIIFVPGTVGGGGNGGGGNGGGSGGGGGWKGGKGIKRKPPAVPPGGEPVEIIDPGGIDFTKLLIPALLAAGAYFLLN